MQRNCNILSHAAPALSPIFHAYHYCQEPYRPHIRKNLSHSNGPQVFQPCNDLWYLPKICSRSWRICLCISISNSERWSRNIVMMSRWFALKPISSSKGRSHSMRTSIVCTIRKIFVTFSNPTIHSMYRSSIASRNGRLSRLSIPGIDYVAILSLSLNATVPITLQWFLNSYFQRLLGQLSESLPSKHPTCVSRTYSQPQPIRTFSMLISRQVVGVFTVQTPHLCLQDLLPTSACRDTPRIPKHVISGNHLTSHLQPMTSQSTCHTSETKTHIIWIKNTQALRCPWLYISNVPT